jgi:hypothetical protein
MDASSFRGLDQDGKLRPNIGRAALRFGCGRLILQHMPIFRQPLVFHLQDNGALVRNTIPANK